MTPSKRTRPPLSFWRFALAVDGKRSSKAHLFKGSIAVCNPRLFAGREAAFNAPKCKNCLKEASP